MFRRRQSERHNVDNGDNLMSEYSIGKQADGTSYEPVIRQVENTINNSFTIDATNNAVVAGPITIGTTATVTVSGILVVV